MEVEMSRKELVDSSSGEKKRREHEVISLIFKKVVIVNTRTGEISWNPRSSESFYLNGSTSRDAKGYNVKKSLSDGILENRNYTHVTKLTGRNVYATTDFQNDGKSAEANDLSGKIREEAEARKARLKQIEDFFTDPVDRLIFPKQEPESPRTRKDPPRKVQSVKESVDQMLAQFRCAMRDENYMGEVYKHRIFPRPQLPPGSEIMSSPTRLIESPSLSLESIHNEMELTPNHKIPNELQRVNNDVTENQNKEVITEFSIDEKSAHRTSWFERLFCCGATSNSKKNKVVQELEKGKKGGWIRTRLRRVFGWT
ncbi:uncharacterized protein LOC144618935 isoform X2 [Crassostrea virginica]